MIHYLQFELVLPTPSQIDDLYSLLKKRTYSISHRILPTKNEHRKFVSGNPYLSWYLVHKKNELIGSVYLKSDNSVGLNFHEFNKQIIYEVIAFIKKHHKPLKAIKSVRRGDFFVNVAYDNKKLITILKHLGINEIQRSFSF